MQAAKFPGGRRGHDVDAEVDPALLKPKLLIPAGATIQLIGLRNAGWLNGQTAEVLSVDQDRRRYEIRIHMDNSIKKVKAENVQLLGGTENAAVAGAGVVTSGGAAGVASPLAASGGPFGSGQDRGGVDLEALQPGTRIELCNLKTASSLNGERAVVTAYDAGRFEIRMEMDGSSKQVRRENFKIIGVPML